MRSYTDQEVSDMTSDQANAAVARGVLTGPQMQRLLGGHSITSKELLRRLLVAEAAEANAAEAATRATRAAENQAAEAANLTAAVSTAADGKNGSLEITGLGSGSAAAIESVLRGRLQGPGHSGAPGIASLAASLPLSRRTSVVSTFLRDPEEGLPEGAVVAALYSAFGMSA